MKQDEAIVKEMREMFVDEVEDMARRINTPNYLDSYTDEQLATMSKVFNQLGNKIWKHRWSDTREERHKRLNEHSK